MWRLFRGTRRLSIFRDSIESVLSSECPPSDPPVVAAYSIPPEVGMPSVHRPFRGDEAEGLWRAPPNPPARTWVTMVPTPPFVPLLEGRRRRIALRLAVLVQNTPSSSTKLPEPNQGRVHTGHPPLSLGHGKQRGRARRSLRRGVAQTWRVFTASNRVTYSQTFWCASATLLRGTIPRPGTWPWLRRPRVTGAAWDQCTPGSRSGYGSVEFAGGDD